MNVDSITCSGDVTPSTIYLGQLEFVQIQSFSVFCIKAKCHWELDSPVLFAEGSLRDFENRLQNPLLSQNFSENFTRSYSDKT